MAPMKNSDSPIACEASSIDPTRISDMRPTSAPEIGEREHRAARAPVAAVLGVGLVLVRVEERGVSPEREEQAGDVGDDQHAGDGEREVLEVARRS